MPIQIPFPSGRSKGTTGQKDRVLAISRAYPALTTRLELSPTGKAGVCFKPAESPFLSRLETEMRAVLRGGQKTARARWAVAGDDLGYRWVLLRDTEFEGLAEAVSLVGSSFREHGAGGQLLAAVFAFRSGEQLVHFIYNYKRERFYPFIPTGKDKERDSTRELSLARKIEGELPLEGALETWYGLYGIPLDAV